MTKAEILKLAALARIKLEDSEVEKFTGEIDAVLNYVSQVDEIVADSGVTKTVGPVCNVFRADVVTTEAGSHTEALLNEAPERVGNMLKVKKILSQDN